MMPNFFMIKIKREVYNDILKTIGTSPIESGGIIGMKDSIICSYHFDINNHSKTEYKPNITILNKVIENWYNNDIEFVGIVHSHHNQLNILSDTDIAYAKELLNLNSYLEEIYFPIVTICDNIPNITFFAINDSVRKLDIHIID